MKPEHKFKIVVVKEYVNKEPKWFSIYNEGKDIYERIGEELKKRKIINRGTFYVFEFMKDFAYIRWFRKGLPINNVYSFLLSDDTYYMSFNILTIFCKEMEKWVKYND